MLHSFFENFLTSKQHSIIEENNIIGRYDTYNLVTKDENYVTMFELTGISYSSKNDEELRKFFDIRKNFFNSVNTMFNISIFQKRNKGILPTTYNIKNEYAKHVVETYTKSIESQIYSNRYYIAITTRNKSIKNFLQRKKEKITTSKNTQGFEYLNEKLNDFANLVLDALKNYDIRRLASDEVLSFYASYCNMKPTKVNPKLGLLSDSYINTNIYFHNDYIVHEDTEKRYSRFITVKAYDTDEIDSKLTKELLSLQSDVMLCENLQNISKDSAIYKLNYKINNSSEIIQDELNYLLDEVKTDREVLIYYTYTILFTEDSLEKLEDTTNIIQNIFAKYNIITVVENINLKTLYMSFFPSRDNLNARKRIQTSTSISVLNSFEKDFKGYDKNSFGENYVALFKTTNHTPYKFNFHRTDEDKALAHTLVIADSEQGKTTLLTYLMTCLMQYDINILAYDKLNGMHNATKYLNGDYADINEDFKLNPFSLEDTEENRRFLESWIKELANVSNDDNEEIQAIQQGIAMMYEHKEDKQIFTLSDFLGIIPLLGNIEKKLIPYKNSIFDNEICMINFENQMTCLAMDNIVKDSKLASLTAMYITHKLKVTAKTKGRGCFQFFDEFKDYLHNQRMARGILEMIVEGRKLDVVTCAAVQNLDFFDLIENRDSFLDGFAFFIIFPTSSQKTLTKLKEQLSLNETEIEFLQNTSINKREVLLKNRLTKESVFLNVDLSGLGKLLKFYNSSANNVLKAKELISKNPENWREEYLK
ncbi:MAG: AAA family ATPase [Arcobacteraceae bacterium]|jgi:type IV secretion/conjugal transfer VirB4 family ATPase|nr:AAA family ATPase [Arcobacteraceae bacterium]